MPRSTLGPVAGVLLLIVLGCAGGTPEPSAPAAAPAPAAPAPAAPAPAAPAPAATAAPATASTARPLYLDRIITPADLDGRTLRELALMRNTIFARAGNPFVKPWLDAYFSAQPWYKKAAKQDLSVLTEVDRKNVAIIADKESSFTRDQLLAMRSGIQARVGGGKASEEDTIELSLIGAALGEYSGDPTVPAAQRNPLEDPTVLDHQLTSAQLGTLSRRDLRLLRNTIYARHGRPFTSAVLQLYFGDKAWYASRADYSDAMLTDVDKRNIQLVKSMEDRLGGPLSEWEHELEEGWFQGA
jgi:YARHG domain